MSLLGKIAGLIVYAVVAVWLAGTIGNTTHNPDNATYAFLPLIAVGLVLAGAMFRRRRFSAI
jgi:cell shape-determining protein MreD